jgi:hypothetical protein
MFHFLSFFATLNGLNGPFSLNGLLSAFSVLSAAHAISDVCQD